MFMSTDSSSHSHVVCVYTMFCAFRFFVCCLSLFMFFIVDLVRCGPPFPPSNSQSSLDDLSIASVLPHLTLVLPALPFGLPLLGLVLPARPFGLPLLS